MGRPAGRPARGSIKAVREILSANPPPQPPHHTKRPIRMQILELENMHRFPIGLSHPTRIDSDFDVHFVLLYISQPIEHFGHFGHISKEKRELPLTTYLPTYLAPTDIDTISRDTHTTDRPTSGTDSTASSYYKNTMVLYRQRIDEPDGFEYRMNHRPNDTVYKIRTRSPPRSGEKIINTTSV